MKKKYLIQNGFWIEKWINKATKIKIISLCLFIINFFCFVLLFIIKKKVIKTELLVSMIAIFAIAMIITFFIAIHALFFIRVRIREYDDYTILVYNGFFKRFLLVEGIIQDKGFWIRFLYGKLPNKKHIWVDYQSPFSIKIGVGEKEKLEV